MVEHASDPSTLETGQEDHCKLQASLVYVESSRLARAVYSRSCLKGKKKIKVGLRLELSGAMLT